MKNKYHRHYAAATAPAGGLFAMAIYHRQRPQQQPGYGRQTSPLLNADIAAHIRAHIHHTIDQHWPAPKYSNGPYFRALQRHPHEQLKRNPRHPGTTEPGLEIYRATHHSKHRKYFLNAIQPPPVRVADMPSFRAANMAMNFQLIFGLWVELSV